MVQLWRELLSSARALVPPLEVDDAAVVDDDDVAPSILEGVLAVLVVLDVISVPDVLVVNMGTVVLVVVLGGGGGTCQKVLLVKTTCTTLSEEDPLRSVALHVKYPAGSDVAFMCSFIADKFFSSTQLTLYSSAKV